MRHAHALCPGLCTLLILQDSSAALLRQALGLGCNGVVVESHLAQGAMADAIRAVIGVGIYADALDALSSHEQEVLQLLNRGYANKEMVGALILSAETIKTHVTNIVAKIQAEDRTHAVVIGVRGSPSRADYLVFNPLIVVTLRVCKLLFTKPASSLLGRHKQTLLPLSCAGGPPRHPF